MKTLQVIEVYLYMQAVGSNVPATNIQPRFVLKQVKVPLFTNGQQKVHLSTLNTLKITSSVSP